MMFPIISWLETASASADSPVNFNAADLLDAKLGLVATTAMPDYELELWCEKVRARARRARRGGRRERRARRRSLHRVNALPRAPRAPPPGAPPLTPTALPPPSSQNKTLTSAGADVHDVPLSDIVGASSAPAVGAKVEYVHPAVGVKCSATVTAADEDAKFTLHVDAPAGSPEEPAELASKRAATAAAYAALREKCRLFESLVDPANVEAFQKLRSEGGLNVAGLAAAYPAMDVDASSLDALFSLAQCEMQRSNYFDASDFLTLFDEVAEAEIAAKKVELTALLRAVDAGEADGAASEEEAILRATCAHLDEQRFRVQWGLLVTNMLTGESSATPVVALKALRAAIDERAKKKKVSPLEQLQQQTWLSHWAIWVFFSEKATTGASLLCDFFLAPEERADSSEGRRSRSRRAATNAYLCVVQSNCPHLLRYISVAHVIASQGGRSRALAANEAELVRVITMEEKSFSGPVTKFIERLVVAHDLEGAKDALGGVDACLRGDYFAAARGADAGGAEAGAEGKDGFVVQFMLAARKLIIEASCRIHQKLDLAQLARKLQMEPAEAEQWMVKIIRSSEARSDESASRGAGNESLKELAMNQMKGAKIDSLKSHILMSVDAPSVYAQLVQKTQGLQLRSENLCRYLTDPAGVQPRVS
jgi:hypothetical protein